MLLAATLLGLSCPLRGGAAAVSLRTPLPQPWHPHLARRRDADGSAILVARPPPQAEGEAVPLTFLQAGAEVGASPSQQNRQERCPCAVAPGAQLSGQKPGSSGLSQLPSEALPQQQERREQVKQAAGTSLVQVALPGEQLQEMRDMQRVLESQETQVMQEMKLMEERIEQVEMATRRNPMLLAQTAMVPPPPWTGQVVTQDAPTQMMLAPPPMRGQSWFGQLSPSAQWQGQPLQQMPAMPLLTPAAPEGSGWPWWSQGAGSWMPLKHLEEAAPAQMQVPTQSGPGQPWLDQMTLRQQLQNQQMAQAQFMAPAVMGQVVASQPWQGQLAQGPAAQAPWGQAVAPQQQQVPQYESQMVTAAGQR